MKKYLMGFFLILLCLFWSTSSAQSENIHVLVNIWDGTEISVLQKLYNREKLPFLSSVGSLHNLTCNEDCFNGTCMETVTKAQHATMLTGCLADVHGVYSNSNYQLIPDGVTVYELIETNNPDFKTAHVSGKKEHFGEPTFGNIIGDVDFFEAGIGPVKATDTAVNLIDLWKNDSFFIVCHFSKPDTIGHKYGVDSLEYRSSIKHNDANLGRLLSALQAAGANAQTTVYVLSDHGFGCPRKFVHKCSPDTFIVSDDSNLAGDVFMKDVAGFFLSHFGLSPVCE
jgi:Type I phosphodiesterase / nucleotide pyrophosphatase